MVGTKKVKDTRRDAALSACAQVWEGARNRWALLTHTQMRVGGISNELKGSRFPCKPKGWVSSSSNDHVACRRWLWIQGQRFETIAAFLLRLFLQGLEQQSCCYYGGLTSKRLPATSPALISGILTRMSLNLMSGSSKSSTQTTSSHDYLFFAAHKAELWH